MNKIQLKQIVTSFTYFISQSDHTVTGPVITHHTPFNFEALS